VPSPRRLLRVARDGVRVPPARLCFPPSAFERPCSLQPPHSYELLREKVLLKDENGHFPLWKGIVAGFSSGVIGQAIASPTDLVKVQMQADGKRVAAGHAPRYTGIGNAFSTIYRQGGVSGLWKGVIPNCQR
jgi:solute carrier family 25 uncoupling protein 27